MRGIPAYKRMTPHTPSPSTCLGISIHYKMGRVYFPPKSAVIYNPKYGPAHPHPVFSVDFRPTTHLSTTFPRVQTLGLGARAASY